MTCKQCHQPWEGRRRNGLRLSRLCFACQKKQWVRKGLKGCLVVLKGLSGGSGRLLGRNRTVSGGVSPQPRRGRLAGLKRLSGAKRHKSSIRPRKLWLKVDRERTKGACFLSPQSKIMLDGRWILKGADMALMRQEVILRDEGHCVLCQAAVYGLSFDVAEIDHIIPRSKGRDDRFSNLQTLCRTCHTAKHNRILKFSTTWTAKQINKPNFGRKEKG